MPETLTMTIGGSGWKKDRTDAFGANIDGSLVGTTHTLTRDFAFLNTWTGCAVILGDGFKFSFTSFKGPACHPLFGDNASSLVTVGNLDCTGTASSTAFDGSSVSGTAHCPVSMVLKDGTRVVTVTE
jgi:hypothetical protein